MEQILNKKEPLYKIIGDKIEYIDLETGYPYLENFELDISYIEETIKISIANYEELNFGKNLLLVLDNFYNKKNKMKINFIESCIYNIFSKKNIEFKYFDKDFKEEISICNRTIYRIDDFNKEKLFKEIILSDIGGDMDLVSKVFIFDMDKKEIFHLYDNRGIAIYYLNS